MIIWVKRRFILHGLTVLLYWWIKCITVLASNGELVLDKLKEYELTLSSPTLEQSIGQDLAAPSLKKFVQIEVTKISNPQLIPLSFTVNFQPIDGEQVYLGSFSLYPPDNPGKFIVATRGILATDGSVSVTLMPLQRIIEKQEIHVWVKPLEFLR